MILIFRIFMNVNKLCLNETVCKPPDRLDQLLRYMPCSVKNNNNKTKTTYVIKIAYDDAFTKDTF